jgi:hypothetical protein
MKTLLAAAAILTATAPPSWERPDAMFADAVGYLMDTLMKKLLVLVARPVRTSRADGNGGSPMRAFVRAAFAAALVLLLSAPTIAADKSFKRDDLADGAIKLEAQIKAEAGQVTKSAAALRREADAAFQRNDVHSGMQILGQIVAVAPEDSTNWLRLARTVLQTWPSNYREKNLLLERAATAAYIAYQRSGHSAEQAESLVVIARAFADRAVWRPALDALRVSLELREVAEVRQQYERMREDHGFRLLDYTVDADAASPRACFQFSEDLPSKRADFSPFVAVGGQDKPALSVQDRQLCVEGLKHGERYSITLRAGIPSQVKETMSKSADFNIYVRDRKPLVRFTGKAYVLPRTGQRGIPVVSVNTAAVALEIYRIGDRNLLETVVGRDFQRNLDRYDLNRLAEERGAEVWKGQMAVEQTLNSDVTTAFPVGEAVGTLSPGVYVLVAQPAGAPKDEFDSLATQWFIVSDLGLTAFSGNDGIHAFVHSLDTTQPKGTVELRLLSRANEVLASKRTGDTGHVHFEANLARGEGSLAPAMLIASDANGDYAFLSLKAPAFDLTDRGVSGRAVPAGLDAFVYTERGVYRSGETVQVTTLLRDGQGMAALRVWADARCRWRWCRRLRLAPGAFGPSPIRSARQSARRPSSSRTTCPIGSNSNSAPSPKASPRRAQPRSRSRGVFCMARRLPNSNLRAR